MKIIDVTAVVVDVSTTAATTFEVGTLQEPSGDWTDDPTQFVTAKSLRAKAEFSSLAELHHAPIRITEPNVYLTFTPKAAAPAAGVFNVVFLVTYIYEGFV